MKANNCSMFSRRGVLAGLCLAIPAMPGTAWPASFPPVKAYRNSGCGCCEKWAQLMQAAGFAITMEDDESLATRKSKLGVPEDLTGCHTALIGDYVIEGHVPPDDIMAFLIEKPQALGLAVPGMPMGSPGMEMGGMKDAFEVVQFGKDGTRKVFARHA